MPKQSKEKIYVVGHKSPDTDSICSAIAYAYYLNKKGGEAIPARTGEINPETKFVLDYFKFSIPELLEDAGGKKIVLLDHNEKEQSPANIEQADILEVIDHHKILFDWPKPIFFHSEPAGATATIIAKKYFSDGKVTLTKKIAGLLLSSILSDTVVFRSSTTTNDDIYTAKKLAKIIPIKNLERFGIEIKKKKANFDGQPAEKIIYSDFKPFDFSGKKVGIGQIEVCDLKALEKRKNELLEKIKDISENERYNLFILMVTDIIRMGSLLLADGEINLIEKAFNKTAENNSFYIQGLMSRKKDLIPPLKSAFER